MTKKIKVNGTIVSDNLQRIYDWIGLEATSPSKVISALPVNGGDVEILINSGGGDVFAASEMYTALKEHNGHVTTKIVGVAASAASVLAMAGDKVLISPPAQLMIHNVSTTIGGDYRTFEHTAEVLKSANQSIANAYKQRTNKTDEELKSLMDAETWFNAQSAVEHGFADEIMFEETKQENTLVANGGSVMLNEEVINKILEMMDQDKPSSTSTVEGNDQLQARFKLLKLGGKYNG